MFGAAMSTDGFACEGQCAQQALLTDEAFAPKT
ncbi:hypothetical protein PSP6_690087 [Paraburkholderia tropica]|nr:hypothetical protein PSP6_690087 [Paraburkholderia tropica]